ncbi:5'-methylthioadenosine/adenosylhomocysteine nucleosidase [Buchnera aphidicola (Macrosiphoniella sanborni)]|uniref:adenosylhomocysteine nucleosidase n=1 Tax=Buchnera aphidicola (Macrosiphoniella sanborni) TaxID=1241865 RepID=A0A4D6Y3Y9_9GAMM|nr:5'-methylthioadenosine/adenosylhomocysteine nucleosidase [Buchnera aphidicola]QCI23759.1 5'-methylthioadenosine/adenosylhomocysteine nucleosidase [Buchnera aphidicola (Macrosiphoniella sanborni)]
MKIGIIGALQEEIKIFTKIINPFKTKIIQDYQINIGKFKKSNIFLIQSGIGKVSASISTMLLINLYQPDIIINSGSAGSLSASLKIGDIILPKNICYYDVDLTNFGYSYGQIPEYPKQFIINKKIYKYFYEDYFNNTLTLKQGLIVSGDSFINNNSDINILKNKFPTAIAVDMESAAIAQVCYKFDIPLIVVKSISDLSNENAIFNFKQNISIASLHSFRFVKYILENLIKI